MSDASLGGVNECKRVMLNNNVSDDSASFGYDVEHAAAEIDVSNAIYIISYEGKHQALD